VGPLRTRLVVAARTPIALPFSVVALQWVSPTLLVCLSSREELCWLDVGGPLAAAHAAAPAAAAGSATPVPLAPLAVLLLRDADLVYQPHYASLAASASPSTPTAATSKPPMPGSSFVSVFSQSLRVQRQAALVLVRPLACHTPPRKDTETDVARQATYFVLTEEGVRRGGQGLRTVVHCQLLPWSARIDALVRDRNYEAALALVCPHACPLSHAPHTCVYV
jgi:hypothetical protein